ncbi:phospholipase [Peribacillus saganii]|uniref:phospholipase D n=1 Tax=Peribacillus saganii TaxID=2303992 RepID=A0A372LRN5_9BACI|nr:phospholipase D family protein [Peribacillus saganii]RFU70883.1 phospholipase [Peribacillus saganii]
MKKISLWILRKRVYIPVLFVILLTFVIAYNSYKPLPEGVSVEGEVRYPKNIDFLYDLTYKQPNGEMKSEQHIFPSIYKAIEEAESFIVMDMFLFNGYYDENRDFPDISRKLTDKLIQQKKKHPDMKIIFITDEINTSYGSHPAKELEELKKNDNEVVETNLERLRDPNPLYSAVWRSFIQWFGEHGNGWVRNPFAETAPKVTLRSYFRLLNIKANHRKVLATEKTAIISSANPHDASGYHSNIAFSLDGNVIGDAVKAEHAVSRFSKGTDAFPVFKKTEEKKGPITAQLITEGKIKSHVVDGINASENGDIIWIGMFYIADRDVVNAITEAAKRGVIIKMVLDPNQNAFGNEKNGLPNLPVAAEIEELGEKNITVRWYKTEKEQFHTKLMMIKKQDKSIIIGGSANYTSRNLDDFNLEENIKITAPEDAPISKDVEIYFKRIWENENGSYTADYKEYQDKLPWIKYIVYRIQKVLRFTTF